MYLGKKKKLKILTYCAAAVFISGLASTASAAADVQPTNPSSNNEVELNADTYTINGETTSHDGTFYEFDAGYDTSGEASHNTLTVNGGTVTRFLNGGYISAWYGSGYGNTSYNTLIINGGTFGEWVEGGWTNYGDANYNTVIINGGFFPYDGIIDGGYTVRGNANNNTVTINGGTINSAVYGGFVAGSGSANENVMNISGGTFSNYIYGGYVSGTGDVKNNTINISGSPDLSGATIVAARGNSVTSSGNKINIYTKNITAKNIGGFESLNFYLPSNAQNGDTVFTLTDGKTDLTSTTLNVNAGGAANLNPGDVITLLQNSNGLLTSDVTNDGTISQGISLDYGLSLSPSEDGTAYTATIGNRIGGLKDQTKALNSAVIDSVSLLDSGTDRLYEWLPPESLDGVNINSMPTTGFDPFAGIGGTVMKVKTGNGSTLESKNGGLNVGEARAIRNRHGALVFGPVTDYGQDHYDSTMEDGTRGYGNSKYFTAGLIARQINMSSTGDLGGMYYEASARAGRLHTSFASNNFKVHGEDTHASYNASTPCYAGHVRIGWRDKVSAESTADIYGIYSVNHVSGITADVSTGETYTFSGVNSGRMRLGARLVRSVNEHRNFYSGMAVVHEFTGETHGHYLDMDTRKSSLKGTYGLIELGLKTKLSSNSPLVVDANLVGMVGYQKGLSLSAKFKREF